MALAWVWFGFAVVWGGISDFHHKSKPPQKDVDVLKAGYDPSHPKVGV